MEKTKMRFSLQRILWMGCFAIAWGSCYFSQRTRTKSNPAYCSEARAERLIQQRLARYGIRLVSNMRLQRTGVTFEADGYDRDMRVGYEYMTHEECDFEDEECGPRGLTDQEIQVLNERQDTYREYFLLIKEGRAEEIDRACERFVAQLIATEVIVDNLSAQAGRVVSREKKSSLPWEKNKTGKVRPTNRNKRANAKRSDHRIDPPGKVQEKKPNPTDEAPEKKIGSPALQQKQLTPKKSPNPDLQNDDDIWADEEEDF
jgi:hypothetical protein